MSKSNETIPLYQQVKNHFLDCIRKGEWQASQKVPSENELVESFGVSRMTANRALRELSAEGYLVRVAGAGTFVAEKKVHSDFLEIPNIADEVRQRGHDYRAEVLKLNVEKVSDEIAVWMEVRMTSNVFHSRVLHYEQDRPIQLEDRYVNKSVVPHYGRQDFTQMTPNEYLMKVAKVDEVEHTISAITVKRDIAKRLNLNTNDPCLLMKRRTWSHKKVATVAYLYHPGRYYELSGRFKPG